MTDFQDSKPTFKSRLINYCSIFKQYTGSSTSIKDLFVDGVASPQVISFFRHFRTYHGYYLDFVKCGYKLSKAMVPILPVVNNFGLPYVTIQCADGPVSMGIFDRHDVSTDVSVQRFYSQDLLNCESEVLAARSDFLYLQGDYVYYVNFNGARHTVLQVVWDLNENIFKRAHTLPFCSSLCLSFEDMSPRTCPLVFVDDVRGPFLYRSNGDRGIIYAEGLNLLNVPAGAAVRIESDQSFHIYFGQMYGPGKFTVTYEPVQGVTFEGTLNLEDDCVILKKKQVRRGNLFDSKCLDSTNILYSYFGPDIVKHGNLNHVRPNKPYIFDDYWEPFSPKYIYYEGSGVDSHHSKPFIEHVLLNNGKAVWYCKSRETYSNEFSGLFNRELVPTFLGPGPIQPLVPFTTNIIALNHFIERYSHFDLYECVYRYPLSELEKWKIEQRLFEFTGVDRYLPWYVGLSSIPPHSTHDGELMAYYAGDFEWIDSDSSDGSGPPSDSESEGDISAN